MLHFKPPSLPVLPILPPSANDKGTPRKEKKGGLGIRGDGGRRGLVMREGANGEGGEEGGRKVKIHFETHFQLGVHKLLSQVSQNGGP